MKNKQIIRPHIVLYIGGRVFTMLYLIASCIMVYQTIFKFDEVGFLGVVCSLIFVLCGVFSGRYLWPQIWGDLLLTDDYILFFGLFLPIVKLSYNDIKCVAIKTFSEGNVMYSSNSNVDMYKFVVLSSQTIPNKRIDKIYSSRKKKIIKYAVNFKLCKLLSEKLPKNIKGEVEYQLFLYGKCKKSQR